MVKGINRQIIEVKNPESEYFDRALLFLKAGTQVPPGDKLGRLAREYVKAAESESTGAGDSALSGAAREYAAKAKRLKRAVGILAAAFLISCVACAVLLIVYTKIL